MSTRRHAQARAASRWASLVFALAMALPAHAEVSPDALDKATAALDQGDFAGAAAGYESQIQAGAQNGHLYYNLGIAYVRLGRVGDAMAAFLAARRLLPRDPDVQANLKSTLGSVKDKLEAEMPQGIGRTLAFWIGKMTTKEFAYATAISMAFASLLVGLGFVVGPLARWRWLFFGAYLVPAVFGASLWVKSGSDERWGAIVGNGTKAFSGPSDKNPAVFELSEGAPVLVTEQVPGGYLRVQLSDGKKGWIPATQVKVF